ncbi:peptide deformylase [Nocardia sp. NPDC058058]|uniref:peptide deformylase n=1 Tax=Nocardia sp. NPDC058058 TaxID=3346317 RepID=UPI0036D82E8D
MTGSTPSEVMRGLGIVQAGAPILDSPTRTFDLPAERGIAAAVIEDLIAAMNRVARVHPFAKGMGIAAPQIGVDRSAAVVRPVDSPDSVIVLLNPSIVASSLECDEQFEGCLSFFDVRGLVPRPLRITVQTATPSGELVSAEYDRGLARLISHEVDHLSGLLYRARMCEGVEPIPIELYRQTGQQWTYEH